MRQILVTAIVSVGLCLIALHLNSEAQIGTATAVRWEHCRVPIVGHFNSQNALIGLNSEQWQLVAVDKEFLYFKKQR